LAGDLQDRRTVDGYRATQRSAQSGSIESVFIPEAIHARRHAPRNDDGSVLNLDLRPELHHLRCRHPEERRRSFGVALQEANTVSRDTHMRATSSLGMMVSRPM
jgi:hypothetical protein